MALMKVRIPDNCGLVVTTESHEETLTLTEILNPSLELSSLLFTFQHWRTGSPPERGHPHIVGHIPRRGKYLTRFAIFLVAAGLPTNPNIDAQDDPQSNLLMQPLAMGYYLSTAPTGPLPRWIWSHCPHKEDICPVCFKVRLICVSVGLSWVLSWLLCVQRNCRFVAVRPKHHYLLNVNQK